RLRLPSRPDAVRRLEGLGLRARGPPVRDGGDDRAADHGPVARAAVTRSLARAIAFGLVSAWLVSCSGGSAAPEPSTATGGSRPTVTTRSGATRTRPTSTRSPRPEPCSPTCTR